MALFSGFATEGPSRRRPFAFDFSPVLLAIQTRIDDNRRHSVRYKVSRVCHAIVYLPAVWEWKKEPFVFFFPPFSYLFPFSPLLSLFSLFLSRLFFPPPPLFSFFFIKHHVAKERGLRGGSSRRGQRHVLRECFSLHTVYTEQCGPDN